MRRLLLSLAAACLSALALSACADQNDRLLAPPASALHGPGGGGTAPPLNIARAVEITAGEFHTCVRLNDGRVFCWGRNDVGQLGLGSFVENCPQPGGAKCSSLPRQVMAPGFTTAAQIDAGNLHTCAIHSVSGEAWCWGRNDQGQIGNGQITTISNVLTPVWALRGIVFQQLSAGVDATCGFSPRANHVACWGRSLHKEYGPPSATPVDIWSQTNPSTTFAQVSVGDGQVCAVTFNGSQNDTYCWGYNAWGQAGGRPGTFVNPYGLTQFRDALKVSAGSGITCASMPNAFQVQCIGQNASNSFPSLGSPGFTANSTNVPQTLGSAQSFGSVETGYTHACAHEVYTGVMCWGLNDRGQLGDGTTTDSRTPVQVTGGLIFRRLAVGRFHTCGITIDYAVYCWGDNFEGQLGRGTQGPAFSSPVPLPVAVPW